MGAGQPPQLTEREKSLTWTKKRLFSKARGTDREQDGGCEDIGVGVGDFTRNAGCHVQLHTVHNRPRTLFDFAATFIRVAIISVKLYAESYLKLCNYFNKQLLDRCCAPLQSGRHSPVKLIQANRGSHIFGANNTQDE